MVQEFCKITKVSEVARHTFSLEFLNPEVARTAAPGQFVNVKVSHPAFPLLRRPMSVCDVEGQTVRILFNVVGRGTSILAQLGPGESIDVLGPLGHGFDLTRHFDLAVIVAGGLGVAPFPFLTRVLSQQHCSIVSFVGGRTANQLHVDGLKNVSVATDDGSRGYRGTVVELLRSRLEKIRGRARSSLHAAQQRCSGHCSSSSGRSRYLARLQSRRQWHAASASARAAPSGQHKGSENTCCPARMGRSSISQKLSFSLKSLVW